MRPDHETSEPSSLKELLDTSWRQSGQGYEPWPPERSAHDDPDPERSLRDLREGMVRGRLSTGARWEVPLGVAVAVAAVAVAVVIGVATLLLRAHGGQEPGVMIAQAAPVGASAVGPRPTPDAAPVSESPMVAPAPDGSPPTSAGPDVQVYVVGQVHDPGVVALGPDARVQDAIEAAGGATGKADLALINLARKVVDGERILVPRPGQEVLPEPPVADGSTGAAGSGASGPVDLNTATVAVLDSLPGVGPVLADRIVEWRNQNGRFVTVDDLNEVSGIGDATMEKLRPLVRV